jgi:hypothetical protein
MSQPGIRTRPPWYVSTLAKRFLKSVLIAIRNIYNLHMSLRQQIKIYSIIVVNRMGEEKEGGGADCRVLTRQKEEKVYRIPEVIVAAKWPGVACQRHILGSNTATDAPLTSLSLLSPARFHSQDMEGGVLPNDICI